MDILKYFIEEPEREFHIREIAKIINKSPTTISKYLKHLEKSNLLISRKEYNHILFKANTESAQYKDEKLAYNIRKIRNSGLIDYLIEQFNYPEAIILFGSFAKSENTKNSDIDLLIISSLNKQIELISYENKLKHNIQTFIVSNNEIDKMKTKNKELLNTWLNGIPLYGFWEVFK